nr:zinc finger BED domain-containing protein RICESLEEPER 2-like [Ipomoea batatas]
MMAATAFSPPGALSSTANSRRERVPSATVSQLQQSLFPASTVMEKAGLATCTPLGFGDDNRSMVVLAVASDGDGDSKKRRRGLRWYIMDPSQGQSSPVDLTNDNDTEITQPTQLETQAKKRRLTSDVWNHFIRLEKTASSDKELARCKYCNKEYTIGSHRYGTSTLSRHMTSCKQKPKYEDVGNMLIDHEGKLRAKRIDHNRVREMISMSIIYHDLPYSWVEYTWVRELHKYLNSDFKFISRNTAATDIFGQHAQLRDIFA